MREPRHHLRSPVAFTFGILSLAAGAAFAQTEIPRAGTLPGVEASPFPYVTPEEVGLERGALNALADSVAGWVRDGEIVGAEILVVKDGKVILHEAMGWSDRDAGIPLKRNTICRISDMEDPTGHWPSPSRS